MRSFSAFSAIVLITNLIQFVAFRADYWLISIFYDHTTVGVYAQASKFAQMLWIIPGILAGLLTPALKNEDHKLTHHEFVSICRISFYIHIILAVLLVITSFIIYKVFLPAEYFNGFFSLLIMVPGYLLFTLTTILAAYFSANRLLKVNLISSIICCGLILLLDFMLIPTLSYKGAAIANLVAYSITTFYIIARSITFIKVPFKDFFFLKRSDFNIFSNKILNTDN